MSRATATGSSAASAWKVTLYAPASAYGGAHRSGFVDHQVAVDRDVGGLATGSPRRAAPSVRFGTKCASMTSTCNQSAPATAAASSASRAKSADRMDGAISGSDTVRIIGASVACRGRGVQTIPTHARRVGRRRIGWCAHAIGRPERPGRASVDSREFRARPPAPDVPTSRRTGDAAPKDYSAVVCTRVLHQPDSSFAGNRAARHPAPLRMVVVLEASAHETMAPAIRKTQSQLREGGYVLHRYVAVVLGDPSRDVRCDDPPLHRRHLSPVVGGPRDPYLTRVAAALDLAAAVPDPR